MTDATPPPQAADALQNRLRLAHQARCAKEHQLDDIRRALCDIGFIEDTDPYSHADLADVIRQAGSTPLASDKAPAKEVEGERTDLTADAVYELASAVRDLCSAIRLETADRTKVVNVSLGDAEIGAAVQADITRQMNDIRKHGSGA